MTVTVVAITGETGLTGLTGLSTFVGFVIDLTQVLDVVTQFDHSGVPYGSGHELLLVCVTEPVYPASQSTDFVSTVALHVGGSCLQVLVVCHGLQTGCPYGSGQVLVLVDETVPVV